MHRTLQSYIEIITFKYSVFKSIQVNYLMLRKGIVFKKKLGLTKGGTDELCHCTAYTN